MEAVQNCYTISLKNLNAGKSKLKVFNEIGTKQYKLTDFHENIERQIILILKRSSDRVL